MKHLLVSSAALAMLLGTAQAADLPTLSPAPVAPMSAPMASNWTGIYVGLGAGYSFYEPELDFDFAGAATGFTSPGADYDLSDFSLIGTIGADFQMNRFVLGALADIKWNDAEDDALVSILDLVPAEIGPFPSSLETEWSWDVLGRAGILITDNVLAYGLVGWTWRDDTELNYTDPNGGGVGVPVSYSVDADTDGLTLGAGLEAMLTQTVSVKGEYRWTDFDDVSEPLGGGFDGTGSSATLSGDQHEIMLGMNIRFNGLFQ